MTVAAKNVEVNHFRPRRSAGEYRLSDFTNPSLPRKSQIREDLACAELTLLSDADRRRTRLGRETVQRRLP